MLNPRKIIAQRLEYEFGRRNLSAKDVSIHSGIPEPKIKGYLSGEIALKLPDIQLICKVMDYNFYIFISNTYNHTHLHFRNIGKNARRVASRIENAFQLIKDYLPKPYIPDIFFPDNSFSDHQGLIAGVLSCISEVKSDLGSDIQEILEKLNLTIIPISDKNADFDAFTLFSEPAYAICVNLNAPPCRIMFSLLHELAHFLFDRDKELGVEKFSPNLFSDSISEQDKPEFIATKFAQFFIISFDEVQQWGYGWPDKTDFNRIQKIILQTKTSKEVAVNALYDILKIIKGNKVSYKLINSAFSGLSSSNDRSITNYLMLKKAELSELIDKHRGLFSEDVFSRLKEDIGIG